MAKHQQHDTIQSMRIVRRSVFAPLACGGGGKGDARERPVARTARSAFPSGAVPPVRVRTAQPWRPPLVEPLTANALYCLLLLCSCSLSAACRQTLLACWLGTMGRSGCDTRTSMALFVCAHVQQSMKTSRYYSQKFPEIDDVVMVNVRSIAEMGAYVSLLEYDNIEGMV